MGLFDYLRCHYPLPLAGANELQYQTKDLVNAMDVFEIRADGSLWHEAYDVEDRGDRSATGFMRLLGMCTRVNKRWVPDTEYLGYIRFYAGDTEWNARVIDGKVESIALVKNEWPPQMDAE